MCQVVCRVIYLDYLIKAPSTNEPRQLNPELLLFNTVLYGHTQITHKINNWVESPGKRKLQGYTFPLHTRNMRSECFCQRSCSKDRDISYFIKGLSVGSLCPENAILFLFLPLTLGNNP